MNTYIKNFLFFILISLQFNIVISSAGNPITTTTTPTKPETSINIPDININEVDIDGRIFNDEENRCWQTQPYKDIKEDCIEGNVMSEGICCYMKIKYKYKSIYRCYPVNIEKVNIKRVVSELKNKFKESKKVSIDCNSYFIKLTFISLLLICLV